LKSSDAGRTALTVFGAALPAHAYLHTFIAGLIAEAVVSSALAKRRLLERDSNLDDAESEIAGSAE
jgi:hypothetical protein